MSKYFFIHIPKTAGTSFRRMLLRQFPGEQTYPTQRELVENGGGYLPLGQLGSVDDRRRDQARLLAGHYPFGAGRAFYGNDSFQRLTFVRSPVARAASNLLHIKRNSPTLKDKSPEEVLSNASGELANKQVRVLSGLPGPVGERHLETAKENLELCDFVGITERFNDSLLVANQVFRWSLGKAIDTNRRPEDSPELSEGLLHELRVLNELDQQLYEFAVADFERRLVEAKRSRRRDRQDTKRLEAARLDRQARRFVEWVKPSDKHGVEVRLLERPVADLDACGRLEYVEHSPGEVAGPDGDWLSSTAPTSLDFVVASHVFDRLPNPLGWLRQVESRLRPDGMLFLVLSDSRYTSSLGRPPTTVGQILESHAVNRERPSPADAFDQLFYHRSVRKLDVVRRRDELASAPRTFGAHLAQRRFEKALHGYEDIQCTTLTPDSFEEIVDATLRLGLHGMVIEHMVQDDEDPAEFFVLLRTAGSSG